MFKTIILILFLLLQTSCFVFVPFIKQDGGGQAKKISSANDQLSNNELSKCLLVKQTKPDKVQIALSNLYHDRDAVRATAATELGFIAHGRPGIIKVLREATWKDRSKWVRRAAVKAIYKLEGRKAFPTLRNALKDKDPWVVHSVKNILKENSTKGAK